MEPLQVTGLRKAYPTFQLQALTFSLAPGMITGLIGRNGAGKTTALKSILGFLHPDEGQVQFFGQPFLSHQREIKLQLGYVSGGVRFYPNKKLRTITDVTRRFYPNWDDQVYQSCLRRFQLDERKTPAQLSEGMKVKYALTLALSHHAKLLILDEPTSGLDPVSREELLSLFLALREQGVTILFSTHITSDLDKCADRLLYLQQGRLVADAPLEAFIARYRSVTLTELEYAQVDKALLICPKRRRSGYEALVTAEQASLVSGTVTPTDLETIMIHLEQEVLP